ncbi:penicillin acylase family protein [Humibacillus sp. DSM 29435]|uniref:penicillin acylase family protein n=1 Tax=Humibacillus sp. DSM 29435 TaxID=1869167 RepID=UPI000A4ED5D9|nr:penicillin acylase family protein [Humibacillus sp. DSM 29435]
MTPRVRRDARGIPHLWADDVLALARLQGHQTALDQAWPMEYQRWRMQGRTAQYQGAAGLDWDRFARQVRLETTARECYLGLDADTRAWVDAYVTGVNEGMPLGLQGAQELRLLGLSSYAESPPPWEPWTPLGIFWGIHLLFGSFPSKLFNASVADRLGEDWLPLFAADGETGSGSNAWLVGGRRTATGKPLLAGDPHRTIDLPSCYQQIGLACPEFDVVGFSFPGVPGVQHFAHAGSVAWGITNAMADYQDLTLEQLERMPDGRLRARGLRGWEPVEEAVETVGVRNSTDVTVPVVVTARGPVVTGLGVPDDPKATPPTYSLRTPTQVGLDLGFAAFLPLLRSRTVDDVSAALTLWVEPVNSALVADTAGRMRHLVVGRVPQRHPDNQWLPVPAWDARHVWDPGWATARVTEVDDVMVSANDRASGGGLGVDYASPFRARRIRELIEQGPALTVDDCAAIHVDTLNGQAALMRELVEAAEVTGAGAVVRERLLDWNGHSDAESESAAVFAVWRHHLVLWLVRHPTLAALHEPTGHSSLFDAPLDVTVQVGVAWPSLARGAGARGVDVAEGVRWALESAATHVRRPGSGTPWGVEHTLEPVHPLEPLEGLPHVTASPSGDKGCVLAAGSTPGVSDDCSFGPVARYVWDLSDRSGSRWVVPFGSSAQAESAHFADQLGAWVAGRLYSVTDGSGVGGVGDVGGVSDAGEGH